MQVFLHLLKMYLRPPDPKAMGLLSSTSSIPLDTEPNMEAALQLLEEHANKLNTTKVGVKSRVRLGRGS